MTITAALVGPALTGVTLEILGRQILLSLSEDILILAVLPSIVFAIVHGVVPAVFLGGHARLLRCGSFNSPLTGSGPA